MTRATPFPPETTNQDEPPFGRDLLKTTLGYIKWGYGALLVSFIVYEGWRLSAQLALSNRDCVLLGALLLTCVMLFVNLWRVREWHEKQMLVSMFIVQSLSEISPQERAHLHKGLLRFLDAQVKKNGRATAQLIEQLNQK